MKAPAANRHHEKVARIAQQLRAHTSGRPVSLRKKAVSHQVPKAHDLRRRDDKIDVGDLTEILEIDPVRRICVAESGVTFVDLVAATLAHGLVPIVVPELKTITIGGAVSGCSIESMSFVHGGFHDTCLEYEVITATGEVLVCTPDNEHRLVFQMMHGAFGTLGIVARLTFRLIAAMPYVRLRYQTCTTVADYQSAILRHFEARDVDFMDGIIHSPTCYVLATGEFADTAPYTSDYRWMKIYYQSTRTRTEDYLATTDYFLGQAGQLARACSSVSRDVRGRMSRGAGTAASAGRSSGVCSWVSITTGMRSELSTRQYCLASSSVASTRSTLPASDISSSSTIDVNIRPSGVRSTMPLALAFHARTSMPSRAANASNVVSMQRPSEDRSMCSGDHALTSPSSSGDGPP
jgi:FAD/FMN-containing dehydrogenase